MGDTFNRVWGRVKGRWMAFSPTQRRNLLIAVVAILAAFFAILWIALRPNYVTIMSGLDNKSLGQVQTQLETLKIPSQIEGSAVLVPKADANTARIQLAMAGLPKSGYIGYSSVKSSFGMTEDQFNLQVLNALQESLNGTIESINGVESAQVHIVMPQQQIFISQPETGAKASVFVELGPGVQLSSVQVAGIQQLVAHSVTGLTPSQVTVTDQDGVTLSSQSSGVALSPTTSSEIALRNQINQTMTQQLQQGLDQLVGQGNAVVIVHADVTFNQVQSKSHILQTLPGQTTGLPTSSQVTRSSSTNGANTAGGPAGQAATNPNLPTYAGKGSSTGPSSSTSSQTTTNYTNSYINTTTVKDPVQIKGYSVAVFLNGTTRTIPASTLSQIKTFVGNSVGQGAPGKVNTVSVSLMPFHVTPSQPVSSHTHTLLYELLGLLAIMAMAGGGYALYRRRQRAADAQAEPIFVQTSSVDDMEGVPLTDDERMREQLANLANKKPEEFASLLRTWLTE
ncbi:MAG: flagellar basal-body MS-ring/collar protein FliF [Alicyclobacillaceae bacterium]|nr:flagellar basal-body MS-ring/collar protein FliF [Alicyclobacillaceae bacterium]